MYVGHGVNLNRLCSCFRCYCNRDSNRTVHFEYHDSTWHTVRKHEEKCSKGSLDQYVHNQLYPHKSGHNRPWIQNTPHTCKVLVASLHMGIHAALRAWKGQGGWIQWYLQEIQSIVLFSVFLLGGLTGKPWFLSGPKNYRKKHIDQPP